MKFSVLSLSVLGFVLVGCGSSSDSAPVVKPSVLDAHQSNADFSQQEVRSTYRGFDLAIKGPGFFIVKSKSGEQYYTRDGAFYKDPTGSGALMTRDGYALQGYIIDENGVSESTLSDINVKLSSKARATTILNYSLNLDARQEIASGIFDDSSLKMAEATSQFNIQGLAYDSMGFYYEVNTYFRKSAPNFWAYHVIMKKSKPIKTIQEGTITFSSNGALSSVTQNLSGSPVLINFGQINDSARTKQFGRDFSLDSLAQDGWTNGYLQSFVVQKNGKVLSSFSNGVERVVYKIPLAVFENETQLAALGEAKDVYSETRASGKAALGGSKALAQTWIKQYALEEKYLDFSLNDFSQGSLMNTADALDLAIQGSGLFIVRDPIENSISYTRSGSFTQNSEGKLSMRHEGYLLQGYAIDESGNISTSLSDIQFRRFSEPKATTTLYFSMNLDSSAIVPTTNFDARSFNRALATSNYSVSMNVYDSLGSAHKVVTYFRKEEANRWSYHVLTASENLAGDLSESNSAALIAEGSLNFSSVGELTAVESRPMADIRWANGAATLKSFACDFGQVSDSANVTTQYAQQSGSSVVGQDGRGAGNLLKMSINSNGVIVGTFDTGLVRDIYQIPLASYENPEWLKLVEDTRNIFVPTQMSGQPVIGSARASSFGEVQPYCLELRWM